jgi:hypothetical protein
MAHVLAGKTVGQIEKAFGRQVGRCTRHPAWGDGVTGRLDAQAGDFAFVVQRSL